MIEEKVLKKKYPNAYKYLLSNKDQLDKRDKGKGNYENWYAYGRTQSLEKFDVKLFFPKMTNSYLNCIIEVDENLLYYNGQAIIGNSVNDLIIIKKLMESTVFWYYIKKLVNPIHLIIILLMVITFKILEFANYLKKRKNSLLKKMIKIF